MNALRFSIDANPFSWARAQADGGDIAAAVTRTIDTALAAEAAGIDAFWVSEDPDGWDAFAVLGAIARQTERIRLGTGVVNSYYRHPSLIAASASTLDLLSNSRAFLGFGRGQTEWYERALGMETGRPLRRMEETIDLLRQWWDPAMHAQSADSATEFAVQGWQRGIRPVQDHLPIYLAAVGPQGLRLSAERADGVIFNDLSSPTFIARAIESIRSHAATIGRDLDGFAYIARASVTITDDPEAEYERRKSTVALIHTLPGMDALLETPGIDTQAMIADIRSMLHTNEILSRGGGFADLRQGGDMVAAKQRIPAGLMAELVIAGSVEHARRRLADLQALGVTDVFLATPRDLADLPEIVRSLSATS